MKLRLSEVDMVNSNRFNPDLIQHFLRPPGNGVFTVHTAQDIIAAVQSELYAPVHAQHDIEQAWRNSLNQVVTTSKTFLLGVCHDNGGGIQRGAQGRERECARSGQGRRRGRARDLQPI